MIVDDCWDTYKCVKFAIGITGTDVSSVDYSKKEEIMEPLLLGVDQAATAVGIRKSKLYELLLTGQIKSLKIGRRRLIPRQALLDFVEALGEVREASSQ